MFVNVKQVIHRHIVNDYCNISLSFLRIHADEHKSAIRADRIPGIVSIKYEK